MPEGPDGKTIIIVKKVSGHGGHHSSSWKVAFADFMTSMMCLFLVLWLVNSASVTTREKVASYFRRPGIFEIGSGSPIDKGGAGILPDDFAAAQEQNSAVEVTRNLYEVLKMGKEEAEGIGDKGLVEGVDKGVFPKLEIFSKIAAKIESMKNLNPEALGDVSVSIDTEGLHIEIMDSAKGSMFALGSAEITKEAKEQLMTIGKLILSLPNPVDIDGHTDARPFRGQQRMAYDNWDLSTDRANSARRILVEAGLEGNRIARVVGYGPQRLKVKEDPNHVSNRRISITLSFSKEEAQGLAKALASK